LPVAIVGRCALANSLRGLYSFYVLCNSSSAKGVLVDGFPRDIAQAEGFVRDVSGFEFALYFDCPEEELMRRLLKRGETSGRVDDNKESIRKRFKTFEKECKPVVDMYSVQRKIYCVDAVRAEDNIFADLCRLFETAFADSEENAVLS
jgi:adenylate kinase family enzyme